MIFYLAIYTIIVSIAMAINSWGINKNTLFLAGVFFIFATYSLTHYFMVYTSDPFYIAIFYSHFTAFWYLPGPLLYFYVRNTLFDKSGISKKDLWHLFPFALHVINMTPYFLSPFSYKLHVAQLIIQDFNNIKYFGGGFIYNTTIATISRPVLILIYCIYSAIKIFQFNPQKLLIKQNRQVFIWLIVLISTIAIVVISYFTLTLIMVDNSLTKLNIISRPSHLIAGFTFLIIPSLVLLFFPYILHGIPTKKQIKKRKKITIKKIEDPLKTTANEIIIYIQKEKPYLNPNFDIVDISKALNIPRHHIIYCFSGILGIKFSSYRSQQRVEYAKKLLESGKANSLSIDGIGQQAGFPSRSTYYATFKAETGLTPNQYLEELRGKSEK